jgi:hypothetical protein
MRRLGAVQCLHDEGVATGVARDSRWRCSGYPANGGLGAGCGDPTTGPLTSGLSGSNGQTAGYTWENVPAGAAVVRLVVDSGQVLWQRPEDGFVLFPQVGDPDAPFCPCVLEALGPDGAVVDSVDLSGFAG